ncbi:S1 family peptidase [Vibrio tapetis]|uniref:Putative trypsin-like serine protease n=1 Tax=Vibrio tapetis subsp. tapetis TaxID=1671868 RepID=A0A2N8ZMN1_9VIBR|nr:serine protease [Vibrio tapetis]SON53170.1 putative trypsin-like serine protease [Vibrio tapetis subsp. tapetis]
MLKKRNFILSTILFAMSNVAVASDAPNSSSIAPAIINGDHADVSNYPYFASLYFDRISESNYYGNICGATIYNQEFVLTAAHCVSEANDSFQNLFLKVATGVQYEEAGVQGGYQTELAIPVKEVYRHPDYVDSNSDFFPNDIALIKLASPLPTSQVSQANYVSNNVASDKNSYRSNSEQLLIIGHGKNQTLGGGITADTAKQLEQAVMIYTPSCNSHGSTGSKKLCVLSDIKSDGKYSSACSGDSGGPLLWLDNGKYKQIGVASYAVKDCGLVNDPVSGNPYNYASAYTEILAYQAWIDDVTSGKVSPSFTVTDEAKTKFKNYQTDNGGSFGTFGILMLFIAGLSRKNK